MRAGLKACIIVAALVVLGASPVRLEAVPAFPGAEGFGAQTPGGRGGRVIEVINLNDSGPGSLRAACKAEGPRMVVFRISGIIELQSKLRIGNPYITIAGQSAPGDGICLKNYYLHIRTHDVILRYLRVRPGDVMKKEMDAIWVEDGENIILDHCSASWGMDETLSVTNNSRDVTVQWCMISESLNESYHHKGAHGYGSIIGGIGSITFHHNVYAHHRSRNPRGGGSGILDFRNNLIYDWGSKPGYNDGEPVKINYVGNYLKPGPSTNEGVRGEAFQVGGPRTKMFVAGNYIEGSPEKAQDNWRMIVHRGDWTPKDLKKDVGVAKPFPAFPVKTDAAEVAYRGILKNVGATLPARDAVDARVIEEIKTGKGRIINSQEDVGGWPEYKQAPAPPDSDHDGMPDEWETLHGLNPRDASDGPKDPDGDGYTNLEDYLNGLVTTK